MGKRKLKGDTPPTFPFTIREYEAGPYWAKKSQSILDNKDCVCALCGRRRWKWMTRKNVWKRVLRFCVHHVSYENVPDEKPEDFLTLCWTCHDIGHSIFQKRNIAPLYAELAEVLERFGFKYDRTTKDLFYGKQK
jgi:hypothetical protein